MAKIPEGSTLLFPPPPNTLQGAELLWLDGVGLCLHRNAFPEEAFWCSWSNSCVANLLLSCRSLCLCYYRKDSLSPTICSSAYYSALGTAGGHHASAVDAVSFQEHEGEEGSVLYFISNRDQILYQEVELIIFQVRAIQLWQGWGPHMALLCSPRAMLHMCCGVSSLWPHSTVDGWASGAYPPPLGPSTGIQW